MAHTHGGVILLPISFAYVQTGLHEPPCTRKEVVDTKVRGAKEKRKRRYRKSEKEGKENMKKENEYFVNNYLKNWSQEYKPTTDAGVELTKKIYLSIHLKVSQESDLVNDAIEVIGHTKINFSHNKWINRHKVKQAIKRQEKYDKFKDSIRH